MYYVPWLLCILSGCYLAVVVGWALSTSLPGGGGVETAFDVGLILIPGLTFLYVGWRLPRYGIEPRNYPMLVGWVVAGVGTMALFLLLRIVHPGVDADWTLGTRAIAFTIGSVGGLLIGLQQTRAISRAQQLERQTEQLRGQNEELAARKRELSRQNRRLDRFAGVVSHDLRSPLSTTAGWIEMAKSDDNTEYLAEATDGLSRMGAIIDNTLELAKQGRTVNAFESIDFVTLAADCWQMTSTTDAELTIHGEAVVCGDPDRLRHLFENLFRNCVEHAAPDVAVTTGTVGTDGIYVEDDGPGIPAAYREVLFEPGYTTHDDGAGFGLAIVAEIVEAHGWTISVTESSQGGARFELTGLRFGSDECNR